METIQIAVISNIVLEPYFLALAKAQFSQHSKKCKTSYIPCEEYSFPEYFSQIKEADIIIVWLNIDILLPNMWNELFSDEKNKLWIEQKIFGLCDKIFSAVSANIPALKLWFLFDDYCTHYSTCLGNTLLCGGWVDMLNIKLHNSMEKSVTFIDLKHLIATVGIVNAYNNTYKYRWNAPYSKTLIATVVQEIYKQFLIEKGISKKCVILDCDDVLWGNVLSEDGPEGIKLGQNGVNCAYQDFQRFMLSLYYHGIILAICSKNDLEDVITLFQTHSGMILKEKHIACYQVNWDNKFENIKKIARLLNIGLDSIVFIDDSAIEIDSVKEMLPEVTTILYDRDSVYMQLHCLNLKRKVNLSDVKDRNKTYQTNQFRRNLKSKYKNYSEYLTALKIKIDIHKATKFEISRISELTQRVNKCGNGKRYTIAKLKERMNHETLKLYAVSVSDCFSDLGLVGAIEVEGNTLTLFCLSCRALGREVEDKMLSFIQEKHQIKSIEFSSTGKNKNVKTFILKSFPDAKIID